ncbi:MAG: class I SAM-dependent methyltransferase [Gemmatimonadota bacterium]
MRHDPHPTRADSRAVAARPEIADTDVHASVPTPRAASGDRAAFLLEFLRHPQQIGSVVPSSSYLEQRLVHATNATNARTIVELGPGTGGTTRALLRAMRPDARLLAIDLSPAFCNRLAARVRDRRLIVQRGSAEDIETFLRQARLPQADAVLSGIPFSTMPPALADRIAQAIAAVLAPGGRFVAYQVRGHVAAYATPHLGAPRRAWEWRNVPPLRVYTWTRAATGPAT